jgi:hypothetical protein
LFFFNIYNSKCYFDLNLSRKFHFTTIHKMAMLFFFILRLIFTRAKKKKVYSIYGHIILIIGHSDPDLGHDTSFSWDTHCDIWWFFLVTSRTGFFLIWPYHLTQRSQWPDFKVRHTVYPSCTSWQSLMTLGMIVFKLWSGHEADRRTDRQTDRRTDTIAIPQYVRHRRAYKNTWQNVFGACLHDKQLCSESLFELDIWHRHFVWW